MESAEHLAGLIPRTETRPIPSETDVAATSLESDTPLVQTPVTPAKLLSLHQWRICPGAQFAGVVRACSSRCSVSQLPGRAHPACLGAPPSPGSCIRLPQHLPLLDCSGSCQPCALGFSAGDGQRPHPQHSSQSRWVSQVAQKTLSASSMQTPNGGRDPELAPGSVRSTGQVQSPAAAAGALALACSTAAQRHFPPTPQGEYEKQPDKEPDPLSLPPAGVRWPAPSAWKGLSVARRAEG